MQLAIAGKNLEITDSLRKYVEKKIGRLDRYLPNIIDASGRTHGREHPRRQRQPNRPGDAAHQARHSARRGGIR